MARVHKVVPGTDTDLSWVFTADDDSGQLRTGETVSSVDSVVAYDADGGAVTGVFAESPAPSVGDDDLTVTARCAPSSATFTEDVTLWVEVTVTTDTDRTVVWLDSRGERPRLHINARP